jgi:hypothetical protein
MYVACHGDYLVQILEKLVNGREPIFRHNNLCVSCLGSGPGSDIVAVLKFLDEHDEEPTKNVTCYSFDKEEAWKDTRGKILKSMQTTKVLKPRRRIWDITKLDSWKDRPEFPQTDLFTMSYFVSEVYSLDGLGLVGKFWGELFRRTKPGALFLNNDNSFKRLDSYFDKQWKEAGIKCLVSDECELTPRPSEEKSVLDEYRKKFNEIYPKLRSKVSYRVLRKPLKA